MSLLTISLMAAGLFFVAYLTMGRFLSKLLRLDEKAPTPAVELRDDIDYVPIDKKFLFTQHFSAIAAAGPIVGPILAGLAFGWLPALLWIVLGAIFIGGIHDLTALIASVRHKGRSIAEVVKEHMTPRAYALFLSFVWLALVYIIVAFTDITASSFVGRQKLENGMMVQGGAIATSSLLYLALPVMMGLLLRFTPMPLWLATLLFLPLVGVAIVVGRYFPLDLAGFLSITDQQAHKVWDALLLVYCFVASVLPMWILLQPRGHLGGFFLLFALVGGALGILFGGQSAQFPAFVSWSSPTGALFPMMFITIACGACSGFHAIIASGTTSKQLKKETDAVFVGYGAMLLEGMVAVVSLACLMMLAVHSDVLKEPKPNFIYASGIGQFLSVIGIDPMVGVSFGLMAFTTFVYDTLDVATRLGRYVVQELTGMQGLLGRLIATAVTVGVPFLFVMRTATDAAGNVIPAWRLFWGLFGASNQLLAALTLLGVTVWLWRRYRAHWVWLVTGIPMAWMYVMSVWAILTIIAGHWSRGAFLDPVPLVALALVGLALLMLIEGFRVVWKTLQPVPAPVGGPAFAADPPADAANR
ncbi:MAG: carbon starvation protein A [Armatimonadetes bacterium]|nr:carbon starvation protein A [Armatimonadota bacterium]MDW8120753.1 carbon starvation CstA family protein [Armatimonadota bacterium]